MSSQEIDSPGYRKAEMITLHDAHVVLYKEDYGDAEVGWSGFDPARNGRFVIDGSEIATLLATLGIENPHLNGSEFSILRYNEEVGRDPDNLNRIFHDDGHRIKELEVRILDPKVLDIRFTAFYEDEDQSFNYTREVTYAGSYTVWWTCAQDKEESPNA